MQLIQQVPTRIYQPPSSTYLPHELMRRPGGGGRRQGFRSIRTVNIPLEYRILPLLASISWVANALYIARLNDLTLSGSFINQWRDVSGLAHHLNQVGADTTKPTWSPAGLNGLGCASFDGGDHMVSGTFDLSGPASFMLLLFQDTGAGSTIPFSYFQTSGNGLLLRTNLGGAGALRVQGSIGANINSAESALSFPMTSPAVVAGTFDTTLATNETEIYHAGTNVTNTRPSNANCATTTITGKPAYMGALNGSAAFINGQIALGLIASGATVDAGVVAALGQITAEVASDWGL